ncbi:hypothetical protein LLY41_02650 [Cytobacillus firmus]|uniref:hypothetical protein n=1 Tax=Cytobacillus firmus TaxID=1399 RepID=UPI002186A6B2|nr:hypothetical protein [Cytobacillus firmus]URM33401.1 hypothetical protein LLY41_02650 [Cytobacillus firmus]
MKGSGKVGELDWFVETLQCNYKVKVDSEQISYEGNELYLDEIDESLIPSEMLNDLPQSLLFETMLYEDASGTEWLGVIALHPRTNEGCLQVILKDGEPVLRKRKERQKDND